MYKFLSFLALTIFVPSSPQYNQEIVDLFKIDFDTAMKPSIDGKQYNEQMLDTDNQWLIFKSSYDAVLNLDYQQKPIIPKIIHQIWLGSPFPEKFRNFQKTWWDNHPDWTYILWTDNPKNYEEGIIVTDIEQLKIDIHHNKYYGKKLVIDVKNFQLVNQALYNIATNYGAKSDIVRYEILYTLGGLYIDTDFKCFRPFDHFHHICAFYSGIAYDKQARLFNGLIGAKAGCPILKECIENLPSDSKEQKRYTTNRPYEILTLLGPHYFTKCFFQSIEKMIDPYITLPVTFVYPWPYFKLKYNTQKQIDGWIKLETFALHHWACSWM